MRNLDIKADDAVLLHGDPAVATFSMLTKLFVDLRPIIDKAKAYARSSSPMLIEASAGPELEMLAQSIHNGSDRKQGPFIIASMSGMTPDQQEQLLFGNPRTGQRGAVLDANHGTLMIQGIDKLTLPLQSQIARVIRSKRTVTGLDLSKYKYVDVRIIASSAKNLTALRGRYLFRSDLLFTLKALRIRIPQLKDRPNDIQNMLDFYIQDFNTRYGCQHSLSESAREIILSHSWEGNIAQLQAFCERMILTAQEKKISSSYVRQLLTELYIEDSGIFDVREPSDAPAPSAMPHDSLGRASVIAPAPPSPSTDPYRDLIVATLLRNHGSRKRSAAELHISTTTLWRKIRQYRLEI